MSPDLPGCVVEVWILCVRTFRVGVEVTTRAYGHVNPPPVADDHFMLEEMASHAGEVRQASCWQSIRVGNPH
jgi:hypothetical protein